MKENPKKPIEEENENTFDDNIEKILENKTNVDTVVLGKFGSILRTIMAFMSTITLCTLAVIMGIDIIISTKEQGVFPNMGFSFNIIIIILGVIAWEYVGVNKTINTLSGIQPNIIKRIFTRK